MDFILNESRQIYISKINLVQDYIENHLEDELRIEDLARIASFSEFHFQRIYRQITGESLYSYIKRLRLEKAVFLLRSNRRLTIQDIALAVGFSNQASFAKALRERYKISASTVRNMNDSEMYRLAGENSMNGKVCGEKTNYNAPMELMVGTTAPTQVLYIRYTGPYKGDSGLFEKLFTKLYSRASAKGLIRRETRCFVAYHDFGNLTVEENLRLSVCISVPDGTKAFGEFGSMELAGGLYAIGRFRLKSDEYQGAWNYMLSKWLPESGYMPDDRLCYEYYPPGDCTAEQEEKIVEIFIPVIPL